MSGNGSTINGRARGGSTPGSGVLREMVRGVLKAVSTRMAGRTGAGPEVGGGADSAGAGGALDAARRAEDWAARLSAEADDAAELAAGFGEDARAAVSLAVGFAQLAAADYVTRDAEREVYRANAHDLTQRAYRCARMAARLCAEVYELREHAWSALQSAALARAAVRACAYCGAQDGTARVRPNLVGDDATCDRCARELRAGGER